MYIFYIPNSPIELKTALLENKYQICESSDWYRKSNVLLVTESVDLETVQKALKFGLVVYSIGPSDHATKSFDTIEECITFIKR